MRIGVRVRVRPLAGRLVLAYTRRWMPSIEGDHLRVRIINQPAWLGRSSSVAPRRAWWPWAACNRGLPGARPLPRVLELAASKAANVAAVATQASLTQFKRLRRLSLDHNRLNDGAVRALEQALGRSAALEEVYVASNPASEESIRRVEEYFWAGDGAARSPAPAPQSTCEQISLSIRKGGGCVCQ